MNYNKEKFLNILDTLKKFFGSQNKMAEALGLSSSYITKIYDENTKNPPAPEYLQKIATNSKGITTYNELMEVCGYLNESQKLDKIKTELLTKKHNIMEKVKELKLNDDEKSFLSYIIDKEQEISKNHINMIKENKLISASEYFDKEISNLSDEISKIKSKKIKKAIDLYDELDMINIDLKLCETEISHTTNSELVIHGTLGSCIKNLRERKKMSIDNICKALNIDENLLISYEEDNKKPSLSILKKISDLYDYSYEELEQYLLNYFIDYDDSTLTISLKEISSDELDLILNQLRYIKIKNKAVEP